MDKINIPRISFIIGDYKDTIILDILKQYPASNFRPLYGPPNEKNQRKLVGLVHKDIVEKLSGMLDFADATMPPKDD